MTTTPDQSGPVTRVVGSGPRLGDLAEIEVRECPHERDWYLVPAIWAEHDETGSEGWFMLDGSSCWWFDPAAAKRPVELLPAAECDQPGQHPAHVVLTTRRCPGREPSEPPTAIQPTTTSEGS